MEKLNIGTILWRNLQDGPIEAILNEDTGDHCFRVDLESQPEPQLISGSGKGLVALTKKIPEVWTHAVVVGVGRDETTLFIRFSYDKNMEAYMRFRKALDNENPEYVHYPNMEPGFRRIKEEFKDVMYVSKNG